MQKNNLIIHLKLKTIVLFMTFLFFGFSFANGAETVVDRTGRSIVVNKPFKKIISLYPAHTENLFSLGLDKEIIGVSRNDDFPAAAKNKAKFHYRADPEKFIAAKPDLVIIRPMIQRSYPNLVNKLSLAGIEVISLQPTSIAETYHYWLALGKLTGKIKEAQAMANLFKNELQKFAATVGSIPESNRKTVYFESIHSKMKTFAPQSMAIFTLTSAGGINAAHDAKAIRTSNIAAYGKERILSKSLQIDVFLAQQGRMNRVSKETIAKEPGFSSIKAVQNGQIFLVDEKLVSRPTLRLLDGINQIGTFLYPEKFKSL